MYFYRTLKADQRREAVEYRRLQRRPWHSPPHWVFVGQRQFIISAACYEHRPVIGSSSKRMTDFELVLVDACTGLAILYAWCVLLNHDHLLVTTDQLQ